MPVVTVRFLLVVLSEPQHLPLFRPASIAVLSPRRVETTCSLQAVVKAVAVAAAVVMAALGIVEAQAVVPARAAVSSSFLHAQSVAERLPLRVLSQRTAATAATAATVLPATLAAAVVVVAVAVVSFLSSTKP